MHPFAASPRNAPVTFIKGAAMARTVEVNYQLWIDASPATVRSQFADIQHHIDVNVHPKLKFELLAQEPNRARFTQEVRLLGMKQRDLFDRRIDPDGSIHDVSIEGFNKGGTIGFRFVPAVEGGRNGTRLEATIRLKTPPLLGWLAPVLKAQVQREVNAASTEDKRDIEHGYQPSSRPAAAMAA
jgi:hypothetical protein